MLLVEQKNTIYTIQVFKDCMNEGGVLRGTGRTVLLVSSNPEHLASCDMVLALDVSFHLEYRYSLII